MKPALLVNCTMLNSPQIIGLGVYTHNLLKNMFATAGFAQTFDRIALIGDPDRLVKLFPTAAGDFDLIPLRTSHPVKRILELNQVVRRARKSGQVLYYSPTHHGVVVRGIRQVLTILDLFPLIFPSNYRQQHYYFRYYLPRVLRRSHRIIAISTNTSEDMKKYFPGVPPCEVVLLGLRNDLVKLKSIPVERLAGSPFFLFVGPNFKYKNADRLIEAFASIVSDERFAGHQLVFAGGRADYIDFLKELIDTKFQSISKRVHFLGYVASGELAWLYQHALATMITTLYEGFGLPALEAMYFGCPVIASDVASLPEVCGAAALMVDPYQVDQIAAAMKQVTVDDKLRKDLIARGHRNLTRFSWQKAAEQVGAVLKEVANQPANQA